MQLTELNITIPKLPLDDLRETHFMAAQRLPRIEKD
jgi:hypothetical protein